MHDSESAIGRPHTTAQISSRQLRRHCRRYSTSERGDGCTLSDRCLVCQCPRGVVPPCAATTMALPRDHQVSAPSSIHTMLLDSASQPGSIPSIQAQHSAEMKGEEDATP